MLQIPLEILLPLLELNTSPKPVFVRMSIGRNNHLFLSDGIASSFYEDAMYDLTQNCITAASNGWLELIEDFCKKGFVYEAFVEKYPGLVEKGRILSCPIKCDPEEFKKKDTRSIVEKSLSEMTEEEIGELHRDNPDQYWDQFEAFV